MKGELSMAVIIFYLGAIFWTLGYDTIYGYQDIKDDEIIGLKSTSIKFQGKERGFLAACYLLLITLFFLGGYFMKFNNIYFILMIIPFYHLFFYQLKVFKSDDPINCLKIFKSNNIFGLIIFINILISKNL
jgi:4-hydroxybenzoate polyprenyltransferase